MTKGQFEEGLQVMKEKTGDSSLHAILRKEIAEDNYCTLIFRGENLFTAYEKGIFVNNHFGVNSVILSRLKTGSIRNATELFLLRPASAS